MDAFPASDTLANLNGLLDCSTGTQVIVAGGAWLSADHKGCVKKLPACNTVFFIVCVLLSVTEPLQQVTRLRA